MARPRRARSLSARQKRQKHRHRSCHPRPSLSSQRWLRPRLKRMKPHRLSALPSSGFPQCRQFPVSASFLLLAVQRRRVNQGFRNCLRTLAARCRFSAAHPPHRLLSKRKRSGWTRDLTNCRHTFTLQQSRLDRLRLRSRRQSPFKMKRGSLRPLLATFLPETPDDLLLSGA
jgi:hypothetical protein